MKVELLKALAEACKKNFQEMTGTRVESVTVKKAQRLSEHYDAALMVTFQDQAKKWDGRFVMCFGEEHMAVVVADSLAERYGQPAPGELNDDALDLLGELMNTVVGHTLTGWEAMGLTANFSPPKVTKDVSLASYEGELADAYVVILNLALGWMVFSVAFVDRTLRLADKKALVVDDSRVIRGIIKKALEQVGITVHEGSDGLQAKKMFARHQPDITVIDVVMPQLGGLDAIAEIKADHPKAKFIVMSSSAKKEERAAAATLGVDRFLTKPVKVDELISAVRETLKG
jgi:CheY-like chemotaxis protein